MISRIPTIIDSSGLVSRWTLDGTPNDSIGGRNGTWVGTSKYVFDSKLRQTVAYMNGSSYITFNPSGLPSGSSAMSFSCWIKLKSSNNFRFFLYGASPYTGTETFKAMHISTGFYLQEGTSFASLIPADSDGTWHHVAYTYNGATGNFYVDGVVQVSNTASPNLSTTGGFIGAEYDGSLAMSGYLSDIRIYNVAKTAAQILSITKNRA